MRSFAPPCPAPRIFVPAPLEKALPRISLPGTQLGDEMPYCELKLNLIAKLSILGEFSWFVVSIDKTIRGHSYSNLKLVLQDL